MSEKQEATLGAGCFWCIEAVFQNVRGVESVVSGYAGGRTENPTYREICSGTTGHAEVARIVFDASVVSFEQILDVFFHTHDPTTLNRQGNDIGTQYRSVVFYHDEAQRAAAEKMKADLDASGEFANPIVTEISPLPVFYEAEDYHQNYYNDNPNQGYCAFIIRPKMEKFLQRYRDLAKA